MSGVCSNCGDPLGDLAMLSPTLDPKKREMCMRCARAHLSPIAFYAFRYALGRKTYAVFEVVDFIVGSWNMIEEKERQAMQREIGDAIRYNQAGFDTDIDQWERILKL